MLTEPQLKEIRTRSSDLTKFHNIIIAQQDRADLLKHIDALTLLLEESRAEVGRLKRSL